MTEPPLSISLTKNYFHQQLSDWTPSVYQLNEELEAPTPQCLNPHCVSALLRTKTINNSSSAPNAINVQLRTSTLTNWVYGQNPETLLLGTSATQIQYNSVALWPRSFPTQEDSKPEALKLSSTPTVHRRMLTQKLSNSGRLQPRRTPSQQHS